jgi:hypothetical protein
MFSEEEFLKALESFGSIEPQSIEYRIHYDDLGKITMCSMQNHPNDTQYLVVNQEIYNNYFQYKVNVDKKIVEKIAIDPGISVKLKKSDHGYAVVKNHAGLILDADELYTEIEYYESIDN